LSFIGNEHKDKSKGLIFTITDYIELILLLTTLFLKEIITELYL